MHLGPYRLGAELGSGGMGRVYRAQVARAVAGLEPGCTVALKVIHPHLFETDGFFARFQREARIGQEVCHPNVVRCLDCDTCEVDGLTPHYLVMEYVEGQTLRDLLDELSLVPEELCRHIGCEVAKGLAAIHAAGAIHRDIKPENVLITPAHEVKIMDLGLARLVDESVQLSRTGHFVGSLLYAAPEALRGREVDGRADLHGLGLVLYELATGRQPFRHDDMKVVLRHVLETVPRRAGELSPQLSPLLEEVLVVLLQKEVDQRFRSADDLLEALTAGEDSPWWRNRAAKIRAATRRPLRRIRIPRDTAVYGRDADLEWLEAAYGKTTDGAGQVLLVGGEAGIGKSRLVDEFVARLERSGEDLNFLYGSYPPGGAATASGAWSTAYREHFAEGGSAAYLPDTPVLVPAFDALLRGEPAPEGSPRLTKESLQTVFVRATQALAAERPTVVFIEDLHFAPEEGRALFASLALAVPGHRVLLIGTARPELPEAWITSLTRLEQVGHRTLPRLGAKDLSLLLEDAFHSERLAEELGGKIARKSDGNPFFAFEIVRGLKEGQFLTQRPDGSWVSTGAIGELTVPSSVQELVNVRVADLEQEDRELLDVAACMGARFDPALVGVAAGAGHVPALKRFGNIERRHRLVHSHGRDYVFDHHQVREALYTALNDQLREVYHASIADAWEERAGARKAGVEALDGELCLALCDHYLRGARGPDALRYLGRALTHLEEGYVNAQAIQLGERALAVPGLLAGAARAGILLRLVDRYDMVGDREAQRTSCEDALALARETEDQTLEGRALESLATMFRMQGMFEEAKRWSERHLAHSRTIGDTQGVAEATMQLGSIRMSTAAPDEGRALLEEALESFRAVGDRRGMAKAHGNLGALHQFASRFEQSEACTKQTLAIGRELGDRVLESTAINNLGAAYWHQGRTKEAEALLAQSLEVCREIGDRDGEATGWSNRALLAATAGFLGDALAYHERTLSLAREIGARELEARVLDTMGAVYSVLHDGSLAKGAFQASIAICRETGEQRSEGLALCGLGHVAMDVDNDDEEARRLYAEGRDIQKRVADPRGLASAATGLGEALRRLGRLDEARKHLEEGLAVAKEFDAFDSIAHALTQLALLDETRLPEALTAVQELEGTLTAVRRMESHTHLWTLTRDQEHLEEAKRLLDHFFERAPVEYHERMRAGRLFADILTAWDARKRAHDESSST